MNEDNQNTVREPLSTYNQPLTFEKVWQMFQETDRMFKETDKKWQETDKKWQETDRRFKEIQNELGGIGKSNGQYAEDFFYSALEQSMKLGKFEFDFIDRNNHRKRNNIEAEYDIVLYNDYKVLIVEVKYNFRYSYLHSFFTHKLKNFNKLYPEYKNYKIYGAIAAMTFDKEVIEEAFKYGFFVLAQNNDKAKLLNSSSFEPNEVK